MALTEKQEEIKNQQKIMKNLKERRKKAKAAGDTEAFERLEIEFEEAEKINEILKQEANNLKPSVIIANIQDQIDEQTELLRQAEKDASTRRRQFQQSLNLGYMTPEEERAGMASIVEAEVRATEGKAKISELKKEKKEATPQVFREFKTFTKSFKKFADFSMSRKAQQIKKGLLNIIKSIGGIIKMVFIGFLKFFVVVSLILVAAFLIVKIFEKFKVTEEFGKLKDFLLGIFRALKPVFIDLFERVKDGFKLIGDAFKPGGTLKDLLLGLWKIISAVLTAFVLVVGALIVAQLALLATIIVIAAKKLATMLMNQFELAKKSFGEMLRFLSTLGLIAAGIVFLVSGAWIPLLVTALALAIVQSIRGKRTDEEKAAAREKFAEKKAAAKSKFNEFISIRKIGSFARGGLVNTPLQIVGEEGPELVALPQGSRIQTASQTRNTLANSNQTVNNFNITVNAKDSSREEMRRMANEISRIISRDIQRSTTSTTLG